MLVESHKKLEGNARFEGFTIDLATELSALLGFNFTVKLVDDGKYGSEVSPGNFNGMLGEVMDGKAELHRELYQKLRIHHFRKLLPARKRSGSTHPTSC